MTEQEKEIVAKASVPMTIANGFRWFFMIIALLILLVLFFGNKMWDGAKQQRFLCLFSFLQFNAHLSPHPSAVPQ